MPINNALLQLSARGAQLRIADALARGYQQGNAMLQAQQAQETRNSLANISQAYAQGGPEAARQVAGQTGQFDALRAIDNTVYRRGRDRVGDQRDQRNFDRTLQRDQVGDQRFNKQFDATQDFRNQSLDIQRDRLTVAQQKAAAKKSGAGKPTVDSAKSAGFFDRMQASDVIINDPKSIEAATNLGQKIIGGVPVAGNFFVTPEFRKYDQAKRDFINAVLRRESGAVISDAEFGNAEVQYFPQPGDGPDVIAQKAQNRKISIEATRRSGLPSLGEDVGQEPPATTDLKSKYGLE